MVEDFPVTLSSSIGAVFFTDSAGNRIYAPILNLHEKSVLFRDLRLDSNLHEKDVLSDFRIATAEKSFYSDRCIIGSQTDVLGYSICEARSAGDWAEVPADYPPEINTLIEGFLSLQKNELQLQASFRSAVAQFRDVLADIQDLFSPIEHSFFKLPSNESIGLPDGERGLLIRLMEKTGPVLTRALNGFERAGEAIPDELRPLHRSYARRQLHRFILKSPFAYRAYHKPLGYAGDYVMDMMMSQDPISGDSLYSKFLNSWLLDLPFAKKHRATQQTIVNSFIEETDRVLKAGRRCRICILSCGPALDVYSFMHQSNLADSADFTLIDFNDETLEYANTKLLELRDSHKRQTGISIEKRSVHQILREAERPAESRVYDLVVCPGLFNYMSDRICKRLLNIFYDWLNETGRIVVSQISDDPYRHSIEFLLEWHVIARDNAQTLALIPDRIPVTNVNVGPDGLLSIIKAAERVLETNRPDQPWPPALEARFLALAKADALGTLSSEERTEFANFLIKRRLLHHPKTEEEMAAENEHHEALRKIIQTLEDYVLKWGR
jgi:extracellular factor (EF) 3-hydroxypalmitic acid methyl ester biosynthesis protein